MHTALLLAALLATDPGYEPGKVSTIKTDDVHYAIRVPKKRDPKGAPAIVFLHGSNMRGEAYVGSLHTARQLDEWVLIGPTGLKKVNERQYNHDPGDERYVLAILDDVEKRLKVRLGRVYVGGHSQGGFLSHAVAAHAPDRIDGVLAVSSGSWASPRKLHKKRRGRRVPVPVAIVHAQNDPVVSFRASVGVYDAYVKAGHEHVRLFAPTKGAHMFMRLPILDAVSWLDLVNARSPAEVPDSARKAKPDEDPRTVWDLVQLKSRVTRSKPDASAKAMLRRIHVAAKKRARELRLKLRKARGEPDAELVAECWTFLADYGMVAAEGAWRKDFKKALR